MAIVGRPNVGKSALFNRIIRRRLAIVHEASGVTRDRIAAEVTWEDERFELIDTGGLALMDGKAAADPIEASIRRQVEVAVQDAAVILLVVDLTAGLLPLDEEVARILRQRGAPVFVAANKADSPDLDGQADAFRPLGFPVYPVSALHNRGVGELLEAAAARLPPPAAATAAAALRVAVVGRPNVGKSSYINRLLNDERVIVSAVPGTTRDSVEIPFVVGKGPLARHYLLVDTAGMRRLGKIDNAADRFGLFRAEASIERADVVVLMLDAERGPGSMDKKIAHRILTCHRGCVLMVNKWDLAAARGVTQRRYGAALRDAVPFLDFVPAVFLSAKTGYNIRNTFEAIDYVAGQVRTEVGTGVLNRVLHDAFSTTQPPVVSGHRLKFYYAVQTGTQPVRFSLFVNNPRKITPGYRTFLVRELRRAFGLEGAPVVLQFRSSHEPRDGG